MSGIKTLLALRQAKHLPNLTAAAEAYKDAVDMLDEVWRRSAFRDLLIENLNSAKPIEPPPDGYPRLRCYRGTGYVVKLVRVTPTEGKVILTVRATYVEEGIDRFDESNGCPGAPVLDKQFQLYVPNEILKGSNKKKFNSWAWSTYWKRYMDEVKAMEEKLEALRAQRKRKRK